MYTVPEEVFAGGNTTAGESIGPLVKEKKIEVVATRLWSSDYDEELGCEFCHIMCEALRKDGGPMLKPAVLLTCMLQLHLTASRRSATAGHDSWPSGPHGRGNKKSTLKDVVFRGGGLPTEHLAFFKRLEGTGQWYRVPHPLATTFDRANIEVFLDKQDGNSEPSTGDRMPKVCPLTQSVTCTLLITHFLFFAIGFRVATGAVGDQVGWRTKVQARELLGQE